MAVLLVALVGAPVIGAGAGWIGAILAGRILSPKATMYLYFVLLASSVIPYGFFITHTVQFGLRTYGPYPGLESFVQSALVTAGTLVLLSFLCARWLPRVAAFSPLVLFICHRLFVVGQLHNQMPAEPLYDNMPSIALLVATAGATAFLVLFAWFSPMTRETRYNHAL
jgi:hypothetical protein